MRDAAAVATGMRGAAMLDYLFTDAAALLHVLRPHTSAHLMVAELDGCPYVLNAHVLGSSDTLPRFCVMFGDVDGVLSVEAATDEQRQVGCLQSTMQTIDIALQSSDHRRCMRRQRAALQSWLTAAEGRWMHRRQRKPAWLTWRPSPTCHACQRGTDGCLSMRCVLDLRDQPGPHSICNRWCIV